MVPKALIVIKHVMSPFNTIIMSVCVADIVLCTSCEENIRCLNQLDIFFLGCTEERDPPTKKNPTQNIVTQMAKLLEEK